MSKRRNNRIRQERELRGWSQARVAEQIGTDAANISRWERGYAMPSPYFREKLCLLFEKTAQELGFIQDEQSEDEQQPLSASASPSDSVLLPKIVRQETNSIPGLPARLLAVLSYFCGWASGLFLFLLARERFIRFHSLQSLLFFSASNLLSLLILVLLTYLAILKKTSYGNAAASLGLVEMALFLLLLLINLFTFFVWIVGMLQAWRGHYYHVPFVGELSGKIITAFGTQNTLLS